MWQAEKIPRHLYVTEVASVRKPKEQMFEILLNDTEGSFHYLYFVVNRIVKQIQFWNKPNKKETHLFSLNSTMEIYHLESLLLLRLKRYLQKKNET